MKRLDLLACVLLFALTACADMQNTVTNTIDSLRDMGEPMASPEGLGTKSVSQRLVEKGECPIVDVVPELAQFQQGGGVATITRTEAICEYGPKSVTVDARLAFSGPPGMYPYFVAIMSPGGKILAKQVFAANLAQGSLQQKLRQIIPITNEKNGASHKILFGFQLSADQLAFNREQIKQKAAAAKAYSIQQNKLIREHSPQQTGLQQAPTSAPLQIMETTTPVEQSPLEDGQPIILAPEEVKAQ